MKTSVVIDMMIKLEVETRNVPGDGIDRVGVPCKVTVNCELVYGILYSRTFFLFSKISVLLSSRLLDANSVLYKAFYLFKVISSYQLTLSNFQFFLLFPYLYQ